MKRRRALRQAGPTSCYTSRVRLDLDTIRAQHQAAIHHREKARFHEMLVGKELLRIRRRSREAWRELLEDPPIPPLAIRTYIRAAQQFEEAVARVR